MRAGAGRRPLVGTSAALALLAALPLGRGGDEYLHVDSTVTKILERQTKILDGCFYQRKMYAPVLSDSQGGRKHADTIHGCQRKCQRSPVCFFFTFFNETRECRLAGRDAVYEDQPPGGDAGVAVAGPRACPRFPSGCTEIPGSGFPGETAEESKVAWASHRVPQNMECWPKNWTTDAYSQCRTFKVLESTFNGWPGKCRGFRLVLIPHLESCESYCKQKLICTAFQEVQEEKPFGLKTCWHGDATSGVDCYERHGDPDFAPLSAKRFMRGNVRVLMDLRGVVVKGLWNVFPETYFLDVQEAAKACMYQCYSNLFCQYWQYYLETGCWVEDPVHTGGNQVQYPATTSSWIVGSPEARTVLAGEYIQHLCVEAGEPGQPTRSEWSVVAKNALCSEDIRRSLGGTGGNLAACKELTLADTACSNQMYSDGWLCSCIRRGEVCSARPGSGDATLYQHTVVQEVSKARKFAAERAKALREHGLRPLDRMRTTKAAKIFEATLTLRGLRYQTIRPTQKVVLVGRFVAATAVAFGVPSSSLKDLARNDGSVTLLQGSTPNETKASFVVMISDDRRTSPDIRDALEQEGYTKSIADIAMQTAPKAVSEGVEVASATVARRGGKLPQHSGGRESFEGPRVREASSGSGGFEWWWVLVLVLGTAVGCFLSNMNFFRDTVDPDDGTSDSDGDDSEREVRPLELAPPSSGRLARQVEAKGF